MDFLPKPIPATWSRLKPACISHIKPTSLLVGMAKGYPEENQVLVYVKQKDVEYWKAYVPVPEDMVDFREVMEVEKYESGVWSLPNVEKAVVTYFNSLGERLVHNIEEAFIGTSLMPLKEFDVKH